MEYSFQSCRVAEGSSEFDGLRGFTVEPKLEGGKPVFTNRRKAVDHTSGQGGVAGSMKMLLRTFNALFKKSPGKFLRTIHTFTVALTEGALNDQYTVVKGRFTGMPIKLDGNEESEVDVPFNATDFKINGDSFMDEIEDGAI